MLNSLKLSHIVAGFVTVLVGYTASVAIIFQAAQVAGASPEQISSWLLMLGLGVGVLCIGLSFWYRTPILTAWSTPGAALLVSSLAGFTLSEAIGAFLLTGVLIFLTGISGIFDHLVALIPKALASALLAGILLRFGLGAFIQLENEPLLAGAMIAVYFLSLRLIPRYSVLFTLLVGIGIAAAQGLFELQTLTFTIAKPIWIVPTFSWNAVVGVTLPLYFVTMASQNIPGIAVLRSNGYDVPVSPLLAWTGLVTIATSTFGGFTFNLAAITAAICAGEEADENPETRYLASASAGIFYFLTGVFSSVIGTLLTASPPALIMTIAGLALFSTINNSLAASLQQQANRTAAGVTFLIAASGISLLGIGSAFWAIVAGSFVAFLLKTKD